MKDNLNPTTILQELIKIKSISGQEQELANWIVDFAKKYQISHYTVTGNAVLTINNNADKCLIFNGHMDTVQPGDLSAWQHPPFGKKAGNIKDGKLYGLGASDMKASLACFLFLALQLAQNETKLQTDLYFCFVTHEEINGQGSQEFVADFIKNHADKYQQIGVVIGEPTDNQKPEIGHRGSVVLEITTTGQSGHSARPNDLKSHAIQEMIKVIGIMNQLGSNWKTKYQDQQFGQPTVCLTNINSPPTSINQVSKTCSTTWDIRTTPQLHDLVKDLVVSKLKNLAQIKFTTSPVSYSLTAVDSYLVALFKKVIPEIEVTVSPAGNDSCFFTQQGIDAVVFGPGQKKVIHQENEYVELKKLEQAIKIYQQIIEQF